jgi:hypothetical protein
MKVTILNGNPHAENASFDRYLQALSEQLVSHGHKVTIFTLRELNVKHCIGCFGCWIKTPGECVVKDDSSNICREYINSDLVLFASPVIMGFTSAVLKKVHEKLLPLLHPYFELVDRETHHVRRYEKYPLMALLLEKGENIDQEDIDIICDIYKRDAINFKTTFSFTSLTSKPVEEVANEIDSI